MCELMKCCANCKYYEHISKLDDEVDWCNCRECPISDDPEYIKSEMSGNCGHYKQIRKEINEKVARKIMMNSVCGKTANAIAVDDLICTEPSIVDQYINKKSATYEREREDAIQKVNEASSVGKAITNFIAALKKAGIKDEMLPNFNLLWNDNCLTDAEKAAIKEIHTAYHLAMTKLHEKCRECVAILVNCETFEQKMTVLQKYDIIDSDYKLKA